MNKAKAKRMIKQGAIILFVITLILVVLCILGLLLMGWLMTGEAPWFGQRQIIRDFRSDKELLDIATDYLADSGYYDAFINSANISAKNMFTNEYGHVPIDDEEFANAIKKLYYLGYHAMCKSNYSIFYQRWATLDVGKGVAFSIDGHVPNESDIEFLTMIEPLKEDGWYYYESDYNEWRMRNRSSPLEKSTTIQTPPPVLQ